MSDQILTGAPAVPEMDKDKKEALRKVDKTPNRYVLWVDDSPELVGTVTLAERRKGVSGIDHLIRPVQFNRRDAIRIAAAAKDVRKTPDVFKTLREFAYYFIELLCSEQKKGEFIMDVEMSNIIFEDFSSFSLGMFGYLVREIATEEGKMDILRGRILKGDIKLIIFSRKRNDATVDQLLQYLDIPSELVPRFSKQGKLDSNIYDLPDDVRAEVLNHLGTIGYDDESINTLQKEA